MTQNPTNRPPRAVDNGPGTPAGPPGTVEPPGAPGPAAR